MQYSFPVAMLLLRLLESGDQSLLIQLCLISAAFPVLAGGYDPPVVAKLRIES